MGSVDEIGKWSQDKLDLLEKYLQAYSNIMNKERKKWLKEYSYIDAFAGSMIPRRKGTKEYIEGSPLRALKIEPSFDNFYFIEIKKDRVKSIITKVKEIYPQKEDRVKVYSGECNEMLIKKVIPNFSYKSKKRAFIFLDPYGLQVKWDTVRKIASARTFDIFVNFPVMGITRLLERDKKPSEEAIALISSVLGDNKWTTEVYQESLQFLLLGERPTVRKLDDITSWLKNFYTKNLRSVFDFVSNPIIMRNSKNSPLYALILASHKEVATKIMNDIFSKYESSK